MKVINVYRVRVEEEVVDDGIDTFGEDMMALAGRKADEHRKLIQKTIEGMPGANLAARAQKVSVSQISTEANFT